MYVPIKKHPPNVPKELLDKKREENNNTPVWLIEDEKSKTPTWYAEVGKGNVTRMWTTEANNALRFHTQNRASEWAQSNGIQCPCCYTFNYRFYKITEHLFISEK